ncbi:protein-disulfide reductase DsbD domain-containing protein [uncultured Polaribacter sp.]|uniref:protein-disulfide reductase DsbD domain-containing protein n=1 Tax=uncultured Polaribacter sp. TaxID=174711 RepID=UPI0026382539|nr:protein-disulfide reductase DsbD domain-containing protein [uncultured Polaribacter sp.]
MFYKRQIGWVLGVLLSMVTSISAQSSDIVSYTVEAPKTVCIDKEFTVTTVFNIQPGWYVYAPIPINAAQGKIGTKVSFKVPVGIKKIGGLELPDKDRFFDTYSGKDVQMPQKFKVAKNTATGSYTITGHILYQTCNDIICYPPVREKVAIPIIIQ